MYHFECLLVETSGDLQDKTVEEMQHLLLRHGLHLLKTNI